MPEQNNADFLNTNVNYEIMDQIMIKQEEVNDWYNDIQEPRATSKTAFETEVSSPSFDCDICGMKFKSKALVSKHIQFHSELRRFECKFCIKKFKTNYELKRHEMIHQKRKRFACLTCGKSFSRKDNLGQHEKNVHLPKVSSQQKHVKKVKPKIERIENFDSNEGKFECKSCGKRFGTSTNLKMHEVVQ